MFDELIKQDLILIYLNHYPLMLSETWCFSAPACLAQALASAGRFVAIFIFRHQNTKALKFTKSKLLKLNRTTR